MWRSVDGCKKGNNFGSRLEQEASVCRTARTQHQYLYLHQLERDATQPVSNGYQIFARTQHQYQHLHQPEKDALQPASCESQQYFTRSSQFRRHLLKLWNEIIILACWYSHTWLTLSKVIYLLQLQELTISRMYVQKHARKLGRSTKSLYSPGLSPAPCGAQQDWMMGIVWDSWAAAG